MADETVQRPPAVRATPEADRALLGAVLQERFKIVSLIARGAHACTYRGEFVAARRPCAIKVLDLTTTGSDREEARKRFLLDTSAAARLTHPNTAAILAGGFTDLPAPDSAVPGSPAPQRDDRPFVIMEFLEGKTLHRAVREEGAFPEERIVHVARQIARSVREAHGLGIIHRDLRPANIFLIERDHEQDFVKVADFGLARDDPRATGPDSTHAPARTGSPRYLSPEQLRGEPVDARTDIYAFGVILYELATGKAPFEGPDPNRILRAHLEETPAPLRTVKPDISISAQLEEVILRCLQKSPELRYASMDTVLEALKAGSSSIATLGAPSPQAGPAAIAPPDSVAAHRSRTSRPPPAPRPQPAEDDAAPVAEPSSSSDSSPSDAQVGVSAERIKALLAGSDGVTTVLSERERREARKVPENLLALLGAAAVVVGLAAVTAYAMKLTDSASGGSVLIETTPPSATVRSAEGKTLCASTPCEVPLSAEEAQQGRRIVVSLGGYNDEPRVIRASDGKVTVTLTRGP